MYVKFTVNITTEGIYIYVYTVGRELMDYRNVLEADLLYVYCTCGYMKLELFLQK